MPALAQESGPDGSEDSTVGSSSTSQVKLDLSAALRNHAARSEVSLTPSAARLTRCGPSSGPRAESTST